MIKEEKFITAEYSSITIKQKDIIGFRGFFADIDRSAEVVHNHMADGKSIYRYPQIQYKLNHGHPMIIAFRDGISAIYPLLMINTDIVIGNNIFRNPEMHIRLTKKKIGDSESVQAYRFISPWLALNQNNYKEYRVCESDEEKKALLEKILIGNILSMCKGFDVNIENRIEIETRLKEVPVIYKGEKMIGFKGSFRVNATLPSYCGIGKGVAHGYGTYIKDKKEGDGMESE